MNDNRQQCCRRFFVWSIAIALAGCSSVHEAARRGDAVEIRRLFNGGESLDSMDSGFTPLHVAVEAGTAAAVRELLRLGADPNCINAGGVPPLHLAASRGEIDILRLLLEHGADPRAKTSKGEDLEAWIEVYDDIIMTNTIRRIQSREGGVSYFRLQAAVKNNSFVAHVQKGNPEVAAMVQHAERLQKEMRRIVAGYVKRNNGAPNTN